MIKKDTQVIYPISLKDGSGDVPSILPADILNTTAVFMKADGTIATLVLTGSNWIEVDPVNRPGLYKLIIPSTIPSQYGKLQISLWPATPADFFSVQITEEVGIGLDKFATAIKLITNNEVVDQGTGILTVYDDDTTTVLAQYYLQDEFLKPSLYNIRRKILKV